LGLVALGRTMIGAQGYGKRISRTTIALGVVGLAAATAVVVGVTDLAAVGVFALIGFHLSAGWKAHRLARAPHPRMVTGA
jgi:hypothetical protein